MKKIFFILAGIFYIALAQDKITQPVKIKSTSTEIAASSELPVAKLDKTDFEKFYIGFTSKENSLQVITLDISNTEPADSSITFYYTLNTKDTRETGVGEILPHQSLIKFQNKEEGRITIPQDGKIEFESTTQDTLKYWKLKEK